MSEPKRKVAFRFEERHLGLMPTDAELARDFHPKDGTESIVYIPNLATKWRMEKLP